MISNEKDTFNSPTDQGDPFAPSVRFYDSDYRNETEDVQLVVDLAQDLILGSEGKVLELGCGTGRLLLPLAAVGIDVTGVDASSAMLERARARLANAGVHKRVTLVRADLRNLLLDETRFDFACLVGNTLMHMTTQAEQLLVLKRVAAHLKEGGHLLIDLFNPDIAYFTSVARLRELSDRWRSDEEKCDVIKWSVRTFEFVQQIQNTLFIYEEIFDDGRTRQTHFNFRLRFLFLGELTLLLKDAGFEISAVWGDHSGAEYDDDSERLIVLARRFERE